MRVSGASLPGAGHEPPTVPLVDPPLPRNATASPLPVVFLTRSRQRSLTHLEWRVRLFGAGALLALVGISLQLSWLIYTAIAVLVAGVALRFLEGSPPDDDDSNAHEEESDGGPEAL